MGYQCFQGACQPPCSTDDTCGKGFFCDTSSGSCTMKPGAPLGGDCMMDSDCSSQVCLKSKCEQGCTRDGDCAAGQTCFVNPISDAPNLTSTTHIVPICIAKRGKAAPGSTCAASSDCDRGSCELGMCVEMCAAGGDCTQANTTCATLVELVDNHSAPTFKGCLPAKGIVDYDGARGQVPLPSNTQSFAVYTHVEPFDFSLVVGITSLTDPNKMSIYAQPMTQADFYNLAVRYVPTEGSSTMLVPNSPRVTLMPGVYNFFAATSSGSTPTSRVYIKLGSSTTGSLPLNIYYTDLTNACHTFTFTQVKNGGLSSAIGTLENIFQQAGVSVTNVNFIDVSGSVANTIKVSTATGAMMLPDLDNLLQAATAGPGLQAGLDVVLVRSITDPNGNQSGVLGIAGGIPTNPVLGTAHSGVAVSIDTLCFGGMTTFGSTMGHELGHSLGLFHNVEMDNTTDPLTDTKTDGNNNLMYWVEDSGQHLTPQQSQVVRNDMKVKP
jgi:hypothetical protein